MNYFFISIYILSIFSIFIVPLYLNLRRDRVVVLSLLPPLLIAISSSIGMLISYFFSDSTIAGTLILSIFIFFEFLLFGYLMMFPILILVAFIVEYLKTYYHYRPMKLAIIGGSMGAIIVAITFMSWKFVWVAFISGFISIWIQYYFTEYKKERNA